MGFTSQQLNNLLSNYRPPVSYARILESAVCGAHNHRNVAHLFPSWPNAKKMFLPRPSGTIGGFSHFETFIACSFGGSSSIFSPPLSVQCAYRYWGRSIRRTNQSVATSQGGGGGGGRAGSLYAAPPSPPPPPRVLKDSGAGSATNKCP